MAYFLKKPYSQNEYVDFILQYNHNLGLNIVFEDEQNIIALLPHELYQNGEVIDNTVEYNKQKLDYSKKKKLEENDSKLKLKRYNQSFTVSIQGNDCVFDTSEQTQSDLQTAAIVTATGNNYNNWVTNNGITLNLSADDIQIIFSGFFPLVSPLYQLDLYYKNAISNAQSVEEVENISIDY